MAKKNFEELAKNIVELIGGKENVINAIHCATRLRFNVRDRSLVKKDSIEKLNVMGTQWSGEQFQIIIGNDVDDVYKEVCKVGGFTIEKTIDENLDTSKKKITVSSILQYVSGSIIDAMAPMLAMAWLNIILTLLSTFNLINTTGSTYQVLYVASQAFMYFIPMFIAIGAAKRMKTNPYMAMFIAAVMVSPSFNELFTTFEKVTLFKIPVTNVAYTSSIFPILLIVPVLKIIDDFSAKIWPNAVKLFMQPLFTFLVMLPLSLCLIGPIGTWLGNGLCTIVTALYNFSAPITMTLLMGAMPFIVMTGMHYGLLPICTSMWFSLGFDPVYLPAALMCNLTQGAASLAVALKSKNINIRSTAVSVGASCIFAGICEPAMYGVNLKYKKPLIASVIAGACAGLYAGITQVAMYGGIGSIFGVVGLVGSKGISNIINGAIMISIGVILTFVITFITYKDEEEDLGQ